MGIVAIRAIDHALIHAMLEGHGELRLHVSVAGSAELGLFLGEKEFWRFRVVDGVAIGADYIFLGVNAAPDVGAGNRLRMAAQAGVESLLRPDFGKRDDGRLAALGLDVSFPGSVAAFASGIFG